MSSLLRHTRWAGYLALALIILGSVSTYVNYSATFYRADRASAWLGRAETAAFAESMIDYIQEARGLLPNSGNPVWWFPTQRTNFTLIQRDIKSIIQRATMLQALPPASEAYQQGMDDLRGKLRTLESQIGEAAPFMFVSPISVILSSAWFILEAFLVALYFKRPSEPRESID